MNEKPIVDVLIKLLEFCTGAYNNSPMRLLKQVGALCVRSVEDGNPRVLLGTSRDTGRWIIPKGWPLKKLDERAAAEREALEEAGVAGKIGKRAIGSFLYTKRLGCDDRLVLVSVFLLEVKKRKPRWLEQHERQRAWFTAETAAEMVLEPELKALIRAFGRGECSHLEDRVHKALDASTARL